MKDKTDKLDFTTKVTNFCTLKDTNKKIKRKVTNWEKTLANHISDNTLVFRIRKQSYFKIGKTCLNRHFTKEDTRMAY